MTDHFRRPPSFSRLSISISYTTVHFQPTVQFYFMNRRLHDSSGRRRPRRPWFSNSLLSSWDFLFFCQIFAEKHEGHERKLGLCDDYKDGNEGLTDPGRRKCRRPDEPWIRIRCRVRVNSILISKGEWVGCVIILAFNDERWGEWWSVWKWFKSLTQTQK